MTAPKFTAADVVVGATVHIVSKSDDGIIEEHWRGEIEQHTKERFAFTGGRSLYRNGTWTVEILDVVPPKPKYVTGGIYRVTDGEGVSYLRERRESGWGQPLGRLTIASDKEYADWGWTIGDRVLVIDYPSAVTVSNAERGTLVSNAGMLIQKAIRAESERGVK